MIKDELDQNADIEIIMPSKKYRHDSKEMLFNFAEAFSDYLMYGIVVAVAFSIIQTFNKVAYSTNEALASEAFKEGAFAITGVVLAYITVCESMRIGTKWALDKRDKELRKNDRGLSLV